MPSYVTHYGLNATEQAGLLSLYMGSLVVCLLVLATRAPNSSPRRTRGLLLTAGAASVVSTLLLSAGEVSMEYVFAGRVLGGIAMAIGTSSAASLALLFLGEHGRVAVGTATILGSLLGNVGAGALATVVPFPLLTVPATLAAATASILFFTVFATRISPETAHVAKGADRRHDAHGSSMAITYRARHRVAGYITGSVSWLVAGIVIALLPGGIHESAANGSALLAALPAGALLSSAWIAQQITRRQTLRLRAWIVNTGLAAGMAALALALQTGQIWTVATVCAVLGLFQGPAYNLGLVTVTHGITSTGQGAAASRYAVISYAACALGVYGGGLLVSNAGLTNAVAIIAICIFGYAVASAAFAGPARVNFARV